MPAQYIELFGYAASFFVAISLVMVSILRLRIINLIGCVFFVTYGLLIGAWPIVIANVFIIIVNAYYLIQMYRKDISSFTYERLDLSPDALKQFIAVSLKDIRRFYPDFDASHIDSAGKYTTVYTARKAGRIHGFAYAFHNVPTVAESGIKLGDELGKVIRDITDVGYAGSPVFYVDYIVRKYRDLGLAAKFHEQLLKDLAKDNEYFIWINHFSNRGMQRLLRTVGYKEWIESGAYSVYRLDLDMLKLRNSMVPMD